MAVLAPLISNVAEEERETDRALGHDVNEDFVVPLSLMVSDSPSPRVADIRLPEQTSIFSNVHPKRVADDDRERREVERKAVRWSESLVGEKETRVRISDPEESVMRVQVGQ